MSQLLPLLATPGVDLTLSELASSYDAAYHRIQLENTLYGHGASAPHTLLDRLINANLLEWIGNRLALSRSGRKTQLLLQAIEGGDLEGIYRRLQRIDGRPSYELVREGMTEDFFAGLTQSSGRLGRLYLLLTMDQRQRARDQAPPVRLSPATEAFHAHPGIS